METKDLTVENLQVLIDLCNSSNNLPAEYLTLEKAQEGSTGDTLMSILHLTDFEFYDHQELNEAARELIFNKDLSEMPLFLTANRNYSELLGCKDPFISYSWIPVVAQWRLTLGC